MKISQKIWFWILQCLGWGIPAFLNSWGKYMDSKLNALFVIAEGLLFFVSGILVSTLLRNYLKRNISFKKFSNKDWKHSLISYCISVVLFFGLLLLSVFLYEFIHDKGYHISKTVYITTLLNSFLFLLFWLIFYFAIKINRAYRQNRIENLQLEATLKESELNILKGQINPHFMFNSLNNIRGLMLEDVEKSRDMITRLSEMLRYSLTKNKVDTIALKEELNMIENYIALSKIQFEDRLKFHSEVNNSLLHIEIPPMIIQMLIENAVKHGVSNQKEGGEINLNVTEKDKTLYIQVSNTGRLITKINSTKVGLENIKKRLHLLYATQAHFSLEEQNNQVVATIKIPL